MSGDDRQNSPSISRQNRPSATLSEAKMVLTKKEYEIIKKHIIDDVPVEQLAQKMGTSRQAVNQSKNRALNKLRMLYQHMEEEKA